LPAFLPLNAPKCIWWPGSAQTRWGSLQRSPDPLAELRGGNGVGKGSVLERGRGKGGKKEGKGRTPSV